MSGNNIIQYLILAFLIVACSQGEKAIDTQNLNSPDLSQTIEVDKYVELIDVDDSLYSDVTYYLPETFEYQVAISFRDTIPNEAYAELEKNLDSLVYFEENDGIKRRRLKSEIANTYFETSHLNNLIIYDEKGGYYSKGTLSRFEYYENMIEGGYVAIIRPERLPENTNSEFYLIGGIQGKVEVISTSRKTNDYILKIVEDSLDLRDIYIWSNEIITFNRESYNLLSFDSNNHLNTESLLLEINESSLSEVFRISNSDRVILNKVIPLPFRYNGEQIFLATLGIPETDASWNGLLIYNGVEYFLEYKMRI